MADLLVLDWGTSSFRAYLLDKDGTIENSLSSDSGILHRKDRGFEEVLKKHLHQLAGYTHGMPVIASGMITSRQGWVETGYCECPVRPQDLAANLVPLHSEAAGTIHFVAGVKQCRPTPDIMRGEECQLAGLEGAETRQVILPGTHSKWVQMQDGAISRFCTFMTGDIYQALTRTTILRALPHTEWTEEGFRLGVKEGFHLQATHRGLLASLFQVRVKSILEEMSGEKAAGFLSGILIGAEIAEAGELRLAGSLPYLVIGSEELTGVYCRALQYCGLSGLAASPHMAARGLFTIARHANII